MTTLKDVSSDLICMCNVTAAGEGSARRTEEEETDSERHRRARVQDGQDRDRKRKEGLWYEHTCVPQSLLISCFLCLCVHKCVVFQMQPLRNRSRSQRRRTTPPPLLYVHIHFCRLCHEMLVIRCSRKTNNVSLSSLFRTTDQKMEERVLVSSGIFTAFFTSK